MERKYLVSITLSFIIGLMIGIIGTIYTVTTTSSEHHVTLQELWINPMLYHNRKVTVIGEIKQFEYYSEELDLRLVLFGTPSHIDNYALNGYSIDYFTIEIAMTPLDISFTLGDSTILSEAEGLFIFYNLENADIILKKGDAVAVTGIYRVVENGAVLTTNLLSIKLK